MAKKSKKTTRIDLNKLVKQNKEQLKEFCSAKKPYFKKITTAEEALITVFSDKFMKGVLKKMCCPQCYARTNKLTGEVEVTFVFSNDECVDKSRMIEQKAKDIGKGLEKLFEIFKLNKHNN